MTENEKFLLVLEKATKAAQRKALSKGIPYAISVNGEIKFIHPDKKTVRRKHAAKKARGKRIKSKTK